MSKSVLMLPGNCPCYLKKLEAHVRMLENPPVRLTSYPRPAFKCPAIGHYPYTDDEIFVMKLLPYWIHYRKVQINNSDTCQKSVTLYILTLIHRATLAIEQLYYYAQGDYYVQVIHSRLYLIC